MRSSRCRHIWRSTTPAEGKAQADLIAICDRIRRAADELECRANERLELAFNKEDARLQKAVHMLKSVLEREAENGSDSSSADDGQWERSALRQAEEAEAELIVKQSYVVSSDGPNLEDVIADLCTLEGRAKYDLNYLHLKPPKNVRTADRFAGIAFDGLSTTLPPL